MLKKMMYLINRDFQGPGEQFGGGSTGGIVGAGLISGLGGLYDTYQRHRDVKSEQEARKKEAELAYQRSVEMWHMQNAYNSPEEQMKRFGAAGLNPHLIYGQGSSGNASGTPSYQPPEIAMRGMHAPYGGAVQSMIPMLMQVGSWMQNMRLTETEISSKETGMDKTRQLIEYLREKNPRDLSRLDNQLSIFPYQRDAARSMSERGNVALSEALEEFRYNWGSIPTWFEDGKYAYKDAGFGRKSVELKKLMNESRLKGAQADWFEPATIMRMVMSGLLGMTGLGRVAGRVVGKTAGRAIPGKGSMGRWSSQRKRWMPSKR